jgi:hypothetical protein
LGLVPCSRCGDPVPPGVAACSVCERHAKAPPTLAEALASFPRAVVEVRAPPPAPPPVAYGDWPVWSEPLAPLRKKAAGPKPAAPGGAPRPTPNACIHCGAHCPPGEPGTILLPDGRYEHLGCWLKVEQAEKAARVVPLAA